ncbi:hypothetical protein BCR37DRAFT_364454 [Protomyces lactucae-debilis]|uniref:Uncharacterized protein n=1 Tax=Protomyces lactucae-debilis TaxID=2754530 RepID=A0A1Y2FQ26_PROLT|nr:uncharacterized protein BCR37DRAFT_364454 [Protomyces lactucae-debilis]ORY86102.1 hypothetical protein BCR37DRAFT_364454 [Protomyces lactucae-debilis]
MALSHFLYTLCLICIIAASVGYVTRAYWSPYLPIALRARLERYMALPTFEDDIERGLTSDDFDLHGNVEAGDDRHGLDATSRKEVMHIMKKRKCNFDQARLIMLQDKMRKAGIDPQTGLPIDSKFVSFS